MLLVHIGDAKRVKHHDHETNATCKVTSDTHTASAQQHSCGDNNITLEIKIPLTERLLATPCWHATHANTNNYTMNTLAMPRPCPAKNPSATYR